jgi:hypothetical protein
MAGQVLIIAAITLALDFTAMNVLFPGLKEALSKPDEGNDRAYLPAPYDHDLAPNENSTRVWGHVEYPWRTDRFGFRTGECAPVEPKKGQENIFVIGDSFTEALGSTYEQSFAGLMACDAARQGKALWNLGVASYSPAIYHRKIRAAVERLGVKPSEIFVFLDLSDIDDDANVYHVEGDRVVRTASFLGKAPASKVSASKVSDSKVSDSQPSAPKAPDLKGSTAKPSDPKPSDPKVADAKLADPKVPWPTFDLGNFLLSNFMTGRFAYDLYLTASLSVAQSTGKPRARWTIDPVLMEDWGRRGLEVAGANLDKIVMLCREWRCRLTLVVYPWPDNVVEGDRNSIQVTHWRDWAQARGVRFIDGFAPFFREPADTVLRKYYIAGDVHFTELGNRLLYEEIKRAIDADCADPRCASESRGADRR